MKRKLKYKSFIILIPLVFLFIFCEKEKKIEYGINDSLLHKLQNKNDFNDIFKLEKSINLEYNDSSIIGQLSLKVDAEDNLFVLDITQDAVLKFDSNGYFLNRIFSKGEGPGEILKPIWITFDNSNNIYIIDEDKLKVKKYNSRGTYLSEFKTSQQVRSMIINSHNDLFFEYYSDTAAIAKYSSGGILINTFGNIPNLLLENKIPVWIAYLYPDINDNIYYCHAAEYKISKYDRNGNYLKSFGRKPDFYKPMTLLKTDENTTFEKYKQWAESWDIISNMVILNNGIILIEIRVDRQNKNNYNNIIEIYDLYGNFITGEIKNNYHLFCADNKDNLYFYNPLDIKEKSNPVIYKYKLK
jgi:hypothetical protein